MCAEAVSGQSSPDDAIANVLRAVRPLVPPGSSLRVVFGCGGDRDRTKRPRMGAAACAGADAAIVTSDNPRTEDPAAIIAEILAGIDGAARERAIVEPDRERAIGLAIAEAAEGDVVVIAGKGHEDYQIFSDRTVHFDDKEEARLALEHYWGLAGSGRRAVAVK